jgi:hypothetical protein
MASVFVLLLWMSVPVAVGLLGYGIFSGIDVWLIYAVVSAGVGLACVIFNFMLSGRARCPLCMVPPLQNRRCAKHRNALKLFGSHSLRVALSILFKDKFRCPYCGEPTAMEVRSRGGRRR